MNLFRRVAVVLVASAAAFGLAAATPVAATYPPGGPEVVTDKPVYNPTEPILITASGCAPGEPVTITVYPPGTTPPAAAGQAQFASYRAAEPVVFNVVAGADGTVTITFPNPGVVGTYTVVSVCVASQTSARTTFSIANLPRAGSDASGWIRFGLILVVCGAVLLLAAGFRRRRHAEAA